MAPFFIHPFFVEVLKGAYRAIHNSDHSILLYDVDTKVMKKKVIRRIVDENLIDGLLIVNMHLNRDEYNLISEKIPLVLVAAETDFADSVIVDNYKGIVTGVQYLFELGHRKVAFINNEKEILESRVREKAFRDEADRLGIRYKIDYREVDRRSGYLAAKTVFNNWPEVTCLFYYSDLMAFGGIDFVNENNLHERVSIIGFDGFEMSSHIGLTTIVQPMEKMGEIGALVLKNKIESKSSELKRIVLETWLEKGKTCRKIAG
jgi:DNA-binding LacI/PurR family transcriptional regulator